jgi:hypothetical protein
MTAGASSHTAELTFILPPDFANGGVGNVPGILMKSNEQARGTPLAGLAVKVTDGFFLVGLSNVDADRARNLLPRSIQCAAFWRAFEKRIQQRKLEKRKL